MELLQLIYEYGLLVVVCGILASMVCGAIKIPVSRKIKARADLTEKQKSDRIGNVCTLIVAVFSVLFVAAWHCILTHSFTCLLEKKVYLEILAAFTFSKIAYGLYEGFGKVSLKKWMHAFVNKIKRKLADKKARKQSITVASAVAVTVESFFETIKEFAANEVIPLTDEQAERLAQELKSTTEKN